MAHQERTYRNIVRRDNLVPFRVVVRETDLSIHAKKVLIDVAKNLVLSCRQEIEHYIEHYPEFATHLSPLPHSSPMPEIISRMIISSAAAGVGPMATVAGVVAEYVGIGLGPHSSEVIVENGGDIFLNTKGPVTVGIYAGTSPLSMTIGLRLPECNRPISVCTSSGTIGHSMSLGKADAVTVVSDICPLADAAATAICNQVQSKSHIEKAIDFGKTINGITGIVVVLDDRIGFWGDVEVVPLQPDAEGYRVHSGKKG